MTDLLNAFQQADCPIGLLIFHKNTEGYWLCTEANQCAEQFLEKSALISKKWSDIFEIVSINTISKHASIKINEYKWLSMSVMNGATDLSCIVVLNDITPQEERVKALEKKIERLKSSNNDLEHFAYVASHDLREPLRKIVAFSERLKKKYAALLEGDGIIYLNRMIDATQRMQTFIDDLLMFSRFSRSVSEKTDVDLSEILRGVLSDFDIPIEKNKAIIDCDNLPIIKGVKSQMTQLFQNLVGNALKFRKEDEPTHISIQCREIQNEFEIIFKDNGIGFEEADAERIFIIFQRLNGRSQYEGTGIGLAICKKIVENHSGSIIAKGQPNNGATFAITLPKSE
jgi:light-regulated signal transduction histidine kinase (bacteriophytochrome)